MKKFLLPLFLGAFGTIFTSCEDTFCVNGSGPIEQREFTVADFHSIEVQTTATVYLTQNSNSTLPVEARGQSNVLDELDIYVSNGTLVIGARECFNTDEELVIFVDFDEIQEFELNSSAEIIGTNIFETDDLELSINGSGRIDLELLADDIESFISGSGLLVLQGECDDHDIEIAGSGFIDSFELQSNDTDIRISGSGSAQVYVMDALNVLITGSGSVFYKGFPDISATITGSGSLVNNN